MTKIILPILTAFAVALIVGPIIIPLMKKMNFGQVVRDDGPQSHLVKSGTPTMGGIIIIISVLAGVFIFTRQYNPNIFVFIIAFVAYSAIGFIDDYIKVVLKRSTGLRAWQKALMQLVVSIVLAAYIYQHIGTDIKIPFALQTWDIGIWIIPFAVLILLATTNAVNLTDGLDGLVPGMSVVYFGALSLLLFFGALNEDNNLLIITTSLMGACLGFLRFNAYPARIFMGDTGSLAIGGAIGMVALMSKSSLWIPLMGFMFMASAISVIIQVLYYKKTKKRVFKMAPLHHHYEQLGYPEMKITSMYIIITTVLCLVGMLAFR